MDHSELLKLVSVLIVLVCIMAAAEIIKAVWRIDDDDDVS
jgi:hypothetical protein